MAKQEAPYTIRVGRGIKAKVWTNNGSKSTWYNVTFKEAAARRADAAGQTPPSAATFICLDVLCEAQFS